MDESQLRTELEQHHAASYGWALSCCSQAPDLAEDILQMAYLKILQGRARYDGRAAFKTWLFAVIRLTAVAEHRRRWLRSLLLARFRREQEESQLPEGGQRLDQATRLKVFEQALARLPKRQQQIMHLVFYQQMSLQEASEVMEISVGSARTHYERAKGSLRAWLETSEHFDEYAQRRYEHPNVL